jgi:hypothetical protein
VEECARRLALRLEAEAIPYALGGDFALEAQHCPIWRGLVELFTTADGWAVICERLAGDGYINFVERGVPWLKEVASDIAVEVVIVREIPLSFIEEGVKVVALPQLIECRLVSARDVPSRLNRDLGDVQSLIEKYKLPRVLGEQLNASVRHEYYRMWDAAQNAYHPSNE